MWCPTEGALQLCPDCGQENNDNNIGFKELFTDFWANYFSFDSRFGGTIKPFFTKSGQITVDFLAGKRMTFANPARFYLLISFLHFFFFFKYSGQNEKMTAILNFSAGNDPKSIAATDSLAALPDSLQTKVFGLSATQFAQIVHMNKSGEYTVNQVYDSLNISDSEGWFQKRVVLQLIKINRMSNQEMNTAVYQQIPIGMFFLLPIVALLLKLFHRKRLYILHVIHALHLHSFALLVLGVVWAFQWFSGIQSGRMMLAGMAIGGFYTLLSFKRVYAQGWFKTIAKFLICGFMYLFVLVLIVSILSLVVLFLY